MNVVTTYLVFKNSVLNKTIKNIQYIFSNLLVILLKVKKCLNKIQLLFKCCFSSSAF